jgi:very-short-patch-repair endonuclease
MTYLIIFAVIIGVIVVAVEVLKGQKTNDEKGPKQYQYKQKNFFMSRAEHECFDAILKAVGNEYHIFPQVHLSSIVDNKVTGQNWKGAFKHISQKSVDFVLCDKAYLSPKLAIELDDKTHERPDRIERDVEVERILKDAGLPLLRLENNGGFNPQAIAEQIKNLLEPQGKPE